MLLSGAPPLAPLAQRFLEGGAGVRCVAPDPSAAIRALTPALRLVERRWTSADLRAAALVVAGPDETRPAKARASAKAARALFHMLGGPEYSDGVLGDVTLGGPMTIGLAATTLPEGLAKALRKRVSDAAPERISGFLAAAARAEGLVLGAFPNADHRDRFWTQTLAAALKMKSVSAAVNWDAFIDEAIHAGLDR